MMLDDVGRSLVLVLVLQNKIFDSSNRNNDSGIRSSRIGNLILF